jgi:hypothetical protein
MILALVFDAVIIQKLVNVYRTTSPLALNIREPEAQSVKKRLKPNASCCWSASSRPGCVIHSLIARSQRYGLNQAIVIYHFEIGCIHSQDATSDT